MIQIIQPPMVKLPDGSTYTPPVVYASVPDGQTQITLAQGGTLLGTASNTDPEIKYRMLLSAKMQIIQQTPDKISYLRSFYPQLNLGYTQAVAAQALADLKKSGLVPMDQWGAGLWGANAWIQANFPADEYVPEIPVGATNVVKAVQKTDVETLNNAALLTMKNLIWKQMGKIESNQAYIQLIRDNYRKGSLGYTQTIATNAIKDLKDSGAIPMDQFGAGLWGQADWVRENYPFDEYIQPVIAQEPIIKVAEIIPANNPNPGAVNNTVPAASPEIYDGQVIKPVVQKKSDEEYKSLIEIRMTQIRRDPVYIKLIQDNYLNGKMGYTQTIATNAIKELKGSGEIPMDQWGEGIWGQADWVRANWAPDKYSAPAVPVIEPVNPNPGATANNTGTAATKPADVIPVEQASTSSAPVTITQPEPDSKMSLLKIVLVVLAIIILIKIISK